MTPRAILALYDAQLRRDSRAEEGVAIEHLPHVTRATGAHNTVLYTSFAPEIADRVIDEQVAHYTAQGRELEWKVYDHDQPRDLIERLAARSFTIGAPESLMVLDLADAPVPADAANLKGIAVRRVGRDRIPDVMAVLAQVWPGEVSDVPASLTGGAPDELQIYVAYDADAPVSAAWIRFHPGTAFADLWGGSTVASHRGRGIYRAIVDARARDARARGARFLAVDAMPMSRPILERLGFHRLATTTPCTLLP
jgi:GNAT superfamily N-acetyltransferase